MQIWLGVIWQAALMTLSIHLAYLKFKSFVSNLKLVKVKFYASEQKLNFVNKLHFNFIFKP